MVLQEGLDEGRGVCLGGSFVTASFACVLVIALFHGFVSDDHIRPHVGCAMGE